MSTTVLVGLFIVLGIAYFLVRQRRSWGWHRRLAWNPGSL